MPTAPAADQQALLRVQELDIAIQQAQHRRTNLPVLATLADLSTRAAELEQEVARLTVEASDIRREVTKAEDDVKSVRDRAARDNARMEAGGMISKELLAMQSELEVLAKRQADLEDIELEAMERLEATEKQLASATAELERVVADTQVGATERDAEFAAIDAKLAQFTADRDAAAGPLDVGLVALYEKQRATHGGVGAAVIQAGACQGCYMNINPVDLAAIQGAAADAITRCEECGRILVRTG